jgi:peptidoglycan hydrolase CwlO-like protein
MNSRRAALALLVLGLSPISIPFGVGAARASTVDDAEQRADRAEAERDRAFSVVSDAISERDVVEAELFVALNDYSEAVAAVADANRRLDRLGRTLAAAEATAVGVNETLRRQAVAAYMDAVVTPGSIVVGTDTVEQAMVVDQFFSSGQEDNIAELNDLTVRRNELLDLRTLFDAERADVEALQQTLDTETARLRDVFSRADAEVASAYADAEAADAAYRAALSEVERARAAASPEPPSPPSSTTTTTEPPTSDAPATTAPDQPQPTTTTTAPPPPADPPSITPEVERWRPLVVAHFPTSLVDEALLIMQCESLGDPDAVNPYSGASGLFQFLPGTWAVASVGAGYAEASVFDPEANVASAAWLAGYYQANGSSPWKPWACSWYLP